MTLDDITPEDVDADDDDNGEDYPIGEVTSRKKAENITGPRSWWIRQVASHNPVLLRTLAVHATREEIKRFIEMLDLVIEDEVDGIIMSDEQIEQARKQRESLLDKL